MFSLEPHEVKNFVVSIRELETALGSHRRTIPEKARQGRLKARRSVFLNRNIKKGEMIARADMDFRRPGYGICPDEADCVVGRRASRDMKQGEMLRRDDMS